MQTHADARPVGILCQLELDGAGALEGAARGREGDEEAVADRLDLAATELLQGGADQRFVVAHERTGGRVPEAALQVRRPLDVGHQDRDRPFRLPPSRHPTIVPRLRARGRDVL